MSGYGHSRRPERVGPEATVPPPAERFTQPHGNDATQEHLRSAQSPDGDGIEICTRVAELPIAYQLGLQHGWIRTPEMEAGMGPATGEVPGVDGDRGDLPFAATTVNDHTGQGDDPNSTCVPAAEWDAEWDDVDAACVQERAALGTPAGAWTPLLNDCHDWVEQTMDACDPDVRRREAQADAEAKDDYATQRYIERTHPGRY